MSVDFQLPLASRLSGNLCLLTAALALFPAIGWSQEYTITDLGTLGGKTSTANAVNIQGQVVGSANITGDSHADPFLYTGGMMTDVWNGGTKFGATTVDINNSGEYVVNYNLDANGDTESFLWDGVIWEDIGTGGAVGLNGSGTVVGNEIPNGDNLGLAYWLYSGGQLNMNAPQPPGVGPILSINVNAINDSGLVAAICELGSSDPSPYGCVLSENSTLSPQESALTNNLAINSTGATCGESGFVPNGNGELGAAFWTSDGTLTNLWAIDDTTLHQNNTYCYGLDDYGDGVGTVKFTNGYQVVNTYALLFDPLNGARDLNKLASWPTRRGNKVSVQAAVSISNTGYIAANCVFTYYYIHVESHACLLTPRLLPILKGNIHQLGKVYSDCSQCRKELLTEANSLPDSLAGLSEEDKREALATVGKMEIQLRDLFEDHKISQSDAVLLLHDVLSVQNEFGTF